MDPSHELLWRNSNRKVNTIVKYEVFGDDPLWVFHVVATWTGKMGDQFSVKEPSGNIDQTGKVKFLLKILENLAVRKPNTIEIWYYAYLKNTTNSIKVREICQSGTEQGI